MLPLVNENQILQYDWKVSGFYSELLCMYISILYAFEQNYGFKLTINENCAYFLKGYNQFFNMFYANNTDKTIENMFLVYNWNDLFGYLFLRHTFSSKAIPSLGIEEGASLFDRIKIIADKTYLINESTMKKINKSIEDLRLPEKFCGIHIRKGDKIDPRFKEAEDIAIEKYVQAYKNLGKDLPIFIYTDDIRTIYKFEEMLQQKVFHLVPEWMTGYIGAPWVPAKNRHLYKEGELTANYDTEALLTSIEILCRSEIFIGTFTANPSKFVPLRHKDPKQCYSLDIPVAFGNHGMPLLKDCGYYL